MAFGKLRVSSKILILYKKSNYYWWD